ncbi:MAG: hypothetical protein ACRC5A_16520 [Enterobacteriaceae bacterium]
MKQARPTLKEVVGESDFNTAIYDFLQQLQHVNGDVSEMHLRFNQHHDVQLKTHCDGTEFISDNHSEVIENSLSEVILDILKDITESPGEYSSDLVNYAAGLLPTYTIVDQKICSSEAVAAGWMMVAKEEEEGGPSGEQGIEESVLVNSISDSFSVRDSDDEDMELVVAEDTIGQDAQRYDAGKLTKRLAPSDMDNIIISFMQGQAEYPGLSVEKGIAVTDQKIKEKLSEHVKPDKITLIPLGVTTKRALLPDSHHAVLGVIYPDGACHIIDSKDRQYPQVQTHHSHFQGFWDDTNCGRYTVYTLLKMLPLLQAEPEVEKLPQLLRQIKKPDLAELQKAYVDYIY